MTTEYIAIGPLAWGKATTTKLAISRMRSQVPKIYVRPGYGYVVYEVGPDTTVDEMGSLSYPISGPKPREVIRKQRKKEIK